MRIVESVLSPKPDNANIKSSVLWSERNVRSLKPVPPPDAPKRTSALGSVLEGTMNFVRKSVLSVNTLSLFAGITCMVAVVLAVWAIYMFKEQKAKMRNLQNMVVDMSLNEAKQRNGGVSNLQATQGKLQTSQDKPAITKRSETVDAYGVADTSRQLFSTPIAPTKQKDMMSILPVQPVPTEQEQMNELKKVQEEVAKLLTNPFNIVMANTSTFMPTEEKPTSKVTIEDITNMEDNTNKEIISMTKETSDQRRRFENMLSSYSTQLKEMPRIQETPSIEEGDDDDFLRDMELYKQQEQSMMDDMAQLQNDLQLVAS